MTPASPQVALDTPSTAIQYVGFWERFFAQVIDTILGAIVFWPFGSMLDRMWTGYSFDPIEGATAVVAPSDIAEIVFLAVVVILLWRRLGATPGKMAIQAIIVDANTFQKITVTQAIIRYVGYIVCLCSLGLGFLWVAFSARKQGWHDLMANTVVIPQAPQQIVSTRSLSLRAPVTPAARQSMESPCRGRSPCASTIDRDKVPPDRKSCDRILRG